MHTILFALCSLSENLKIPFLEQTDKFRREKFVYPIFLGRHDRRHHCERNFLFGFKIRFFFDLYLKKIYFWPFSIFGRQLRENCLGDFSANPTVLFAMMSSIQGNSKIKFWSQTILA